MSRCAGATSEPNELGSVRRMWNSLTAPMGVAPTGLLTDWEPFSLTTLTHITVYPPPCPHTPCLGMNEAEYQERYRQFHAFINCKAQATYRITDDSDIAMVSNGLPCLFDGWLQPVPCENCLKFWKDYRRTDDRTSCEIAVFLRTSRKGRR